MANSLPAIMGRRIDPSWWIILGSTTGVTKTGMCYPVSGMVHIKEILLLNEKSNPQNGSSGFHPSLSD